MGSELTALASAAALTLVTAMTTDAWRALRSQVAKLVGRGDPPAEAAALEMLDDDAQAVVGADGEGAVIEELRTQWTVRFRDLLRTEPDVAATLRVLVAELSAQDVAASGGVAAGRDVTIRADRGGVAAGRVEGGVHLGSPPRPGTERA